MKCKINVRAKSYMNLTKIFKIIIGEIGFSLTTKILKL